MTAGRLQLNPGYYWQISVSKSYPVASKAAIKVKSSVGAGSQTVSFGVFGSETYQTVTESGWTQIINSVPANSSSSLLIKNYGGAAIDILVDELQLVPGASVPAFVSPFAGGYHAYPNVVLPGSIPLAGAAADLTSGIALQAIRASLDGAIGDFTLLAQATTTDTTIGAAKLVSFEQNVAADGSTGVDHGNFYGAPVLLQNNTGANLGIADGNWHTFLTRKSAAEMAAFLDGIKIATNSGNSTTINPAQVYIGSANDSNGPFPFLGKVSQVTVWYRALSDAEVTQALTVYAARQAAMALPAVVRKSNWWTAEGDSITALSGNYWGLFFPHSGFLGSNSAVSGSTLNDCNSRLPGVLAQVGSNAAYGVNPIVSLLIGANGLPTLGQLQTYWSSIRGAGGKIIACTVTPRNDSTFNTNRDALNAQIRAATSSYDALCDFAADGTIGTDAAGSNTTYYPDGTHPSGACYAIMESIMAAALASVQV